MAKRGRLRKHGGTVYKRNDSDIWQVHYKDQKGEMIRRLQRIASRRSDSLGDRLDARDEGRLAALLGSKRLTFNEWADWFLEKRSKPPFRSEGNHQVNVNALKSLRQRLARRRCKTLLRRGSRTFWRSDCNRNAEYGRKIGIQLRGVIKPSTAHQEFRVLTHILNVAVKQKRLVWNPCVSVEFPVSVRKATRKPHSMTASEQQKIEFAAPGYLRDIVIIVSELGLRYKKELLPMKKQQVDRENGIVHIADSKTTSGIGDMPITVAARDAFRRQMEETPGTEYLFPSPITTGKKPHMTQPAQGLGGHAEEGGPAIFGARRASTHVRHPAECGRRRRSHGDADVVAKPRGGVQATNAFPAHRTSTEPIFAQFHPQLGAGCTFSRRREI